MAELALALALSPSGAIKPGKVEKTGKPDPTAGTTTPATDGSAPKPFADLMAKAAPPQPDRTATANPTVIAAIATDKTKASGEDSSDDKTGDDDAAKTPESHDPLGDAISAGLTAILALAPTVAGQTTPVATAKPQARPATASVSTMAMARAAVTLPAIGQPTLSQGAASQPGATASATEPATVPTTDPTGTPAGPLGELIRTMQNAAGTAPTAATATAPSAAPAQPVPASMQGQSVTTTLPLPGPALAPVSTGGALQTHAEDAPKAIVTPLGELATDAPSLPAAQPAPAAAATVPAQIDGIAATVSTPAPPPLQAASAAAASAPAEVAPAAQPAPQSPTDGAASPAAPTAAGQTPPQAPAAYGNAVPVATPAQPRDVTGIASVASAAAATATSAPSTGPVAAKGPQPARVDQRTASPAAIRDAGAGTSVAGQGRADARSSNDRSKDRDGRAGTQRDTAAGDAALPVAPAASTGADRRTDAVGATANGTPSVADAAFQQQLNVAHDGQWLDQLTKDIVGSAGTGKDLSFKLTPAHLGALAVTISQGSDGAAVRMTTDSADTRNMLIDAQPRLVAEARAQGLKISETHVDLSHQQQQQSSSTNSSWSGGGAAAQQQQAGGQQRQPLPDRQPFSRNTAPADNEPGSTSDSDALYA